jgi:serine/threonine-protein kinase
MTSAGLPLHTTMSAAARWEQLATVFEGAVALPESERLEYIRAQCPDASAAAELRALLAVYSTSPGPLDRIMAAVAPMTHAWVVSETRTRVGPYALLREIGRGGMGVVYLAKRADGEYQRQVALKLARAPVLDPALRTRFVAERDILAALAHPNIASLFDGGVTEDGLPYFTMEYVDGIAIDVFCDAQRLDLGARIRLVLGICSAVAAAHRALVVHRDLKPTNVLVTPAGDVKLLDFGIAKLLAPGAHDPASDTAPDARVMTPAYASPEQVSGQPVSTATDVHALGLLLYELLCGRRAWRLAGDHATLEQIVMHADAMPMSLALMTPDGDDSRSAAAIAAGRQTSPRRLARQLRGDLERITTMALAKDPDRRYPTAAQLADDLQRYLDGRPVIARGHSLPYRAARFARRHRLAVVIAVMAAVTLAGYLVLAIRHGHEMEQAAAREREEARRAGEVADFVVGLFDASDPDVVQDREAPLARLLEQGLERAATLAAQPLLQARLLNAIGRVYFNLGRYDEAAAVARRALAVSRVAAGERHADVARDNRLLGLVTGALGRQHEAVELFRAALDIRRLTDGPGSTEFATDQHHLGYALAQTGDLPEAERQVSASLALRRSLLPAGHEDIATSLSGLAFVRGRQGRPHESAELYRAALSLRVARLGERHPEVARGRQNLAAALTTAGVFDQAQAELSRAVEIYREAYGEQHPSIATTLNNLGTLEARRRRNREAIRYFRAAFEMRRRLLGPEHPSTLLSQSNLASLFGRVGRLREGEEMLRDVLQRGGAGHELAMGITRPQTMANLAHLIRLQGRSAEAEAVAREALALAAARGTNPLVEASILHTLGLTLSEQARHSEALSLLQRALDIRRERLGAKHPDVLRTQSDLENALPDRRRASRLPR